jgi:hypothetical protein
MFIRAILTFVK